METFKIDVDAVQARLESPEFARVAQSLSEIGIHSAVDLFANYAGRASDLGGWLADATINRDRNLRLQYLAGMGLNLYENAAIYDDILVHRKFPEDIFSGSEERLGQLRAAVQRFGN